MSAKKVRCCRDHSDTPEYSKKLQGPNHHAGRLLTIHVTKATGFAFLGVVKTTGPVDGNVALLAVETRRALHAASGTNAAKLEQAVKDGAIVPDVELGLLFLVRVHVVWSHLLKEVDVFVRVELGHFAAGRWFRALAGKSSSVNKNRQATTGKRHLQRGWLT